MNWIELKALHSLYLNREININGTIAASPEINYLATSLGVVDKSHRKLYALPSFNQLYSSKYLSKFTAYECFLKEHGFLTPHIRYEAADIEILMHIDALKKEGTLEALRLQILDAGESLRGVSLMFFRNEKYLDTRPSLVNALKKILGVETFANEKDQQYIYKLECHEPTCIVLCENLDFLTKPVKPRQHHIELWYAGGKNIQKLDYADTRGLPVFYSCDWDYDGLFIIFPLVKEKIPAIQLLTPDGPPRGIKDTMHASQWDAAGKNIDHLLSALQKDALTGLIANDQWVIEESNNLIKMLGLT